ncbi:MAG: hypothetical protein QM651_16070 [Rhodoblastus sp.]
MNIGPVRSASPLPPFSEFVAAAALRRRPADDIATAFRIVAPDMPSLPASAAASPRAAMARTAPAGYAEILDLAENLALPESLGRAAALAAVSRLLRALAATHVQSPAEFERAAAITPREKLPERNAAHAESALTAALVVDDEARGLVTLDVHAARVDDNLWRIAVFDQSAAIFGTFPYAAPPLLVVSAQFDPAQAAFAAAAGIVGGFSWRSKGIVAAFTGNSAAPATLGLIAAMVVVVLLLAGAPLAAALVAFLALALLRRRARRSRRDADA